MNSFLCISVRFLQPLSHGRKDGGEPEWPPSPFRLFQSLVAGSAGRWNERLLLDYAVPALAWLERQMPKVILAPTSITTDTPYLLYVPNNTTDLLVPAWKQGDVSKSTKREQKLVRPTHLAGEAVNYLYVLPPEGCPYLEVLTSAARSITHLGWGIDMVAAEARLITSEEADKLPGHRWRVVPSGGVALRVPRAGTLQDLIQKHQAFLGRLTSDGFRPVPPLKCFDVKQYYSATVPGLNPISRPFAAFEIHRTIDDQEANPGKSRFRPFHHVRKVATVAGMLRHALAAVASQMGKNTAWINEHVLGHGEEKDGQSTSDERFMFLPLPSITPVGISGIRRALVVGWPGSEQELANVRRRLNGWELIDEDKSEPVAMLTHIPTSDKGIIPFTGSSRTWSTVTPVILPGHDDPDGLWRKLREHDGKDSQEQRRLLDRLHQRIHGLIEKAFEHAGWPKDALAGAEIEYRAIGWFRGLDPASHYHLPPISYPKYHLRITFPREVLGPFAIGAGRYRGFGLFARLDASASS